MVDCQKDLVGSDERAAHSAIWKAETHSKAAINLKAQRYGATVKIGLGVTGGGQGTDVYVALADDYAKSHVMRGENSGHTLHHVAVVRTVLLAGKTAAQGVLARDLAVPLKNGSGALRLVVFLQYPGSKHIFVVAQTRL